RIGSPEARKHVLLPADHVRDERFGRTRLARRLIVVLLRLLVEEAVRDVARLDIVQLAIAHGRPVRDGRSRADGAIPSGEQHAHDPAIEQAVCDLYRLDVRDADLADTG